jgi:hypothetical protein
MPSEVNFTLDNDDPSVFLGMLHDMVKYCEEQSFDAFFAWMQEWHGNMDVGLDPEMAKGNLRSLHEQIHDMVLGIGLNELIDDASAFLNSLGNGDSRTEGNSL